MRHLRQVIIFSLLISAGLLLWPTLDLLDESAEEVSPASLSAGSGLYDYYIEDFVLIGTDNSGRPYRLTAKRMERYDAEDRSELVEPFLSQELAEPPRTIRAERGQLSRQETLLELQDNVILVRGPADGLQETTTSQRMQVDLK